MNNHRVVFFLKMTMITMMMTMAKRMSSAVIFMPTRSNVSLMTSVSWTSLISRKPSPDSDPSNAADADKDKDYDGDGDVDDGSDDIKTWYTSN